MAALKDVFGHNIKNYSGTFPHKPGNHHVHFLVMSEAPKTKSAVTSIAASMALIFGTETDSVEVKLFNELKADAGPAHGLKGLGDYRSLYVNNNDHANHRPENPEHRTVEFMCGGDWEISHGGARNGSGRQGTVQVASRPGLQSCSARRMRSSSVCWKLLQTVWVAPYVPCRRCQASFVLCPNV